MDLGTFSGVLAERAAKAALATDDAEQEGDEQQDMGSLTGWQALADQVCPHPHHPSSLAAVQKWHTTTGRGAAQKQWQGMLQVT